MRQRNPVEPAHASSERSALRAVARSPSETARYGRTSTAARARRRALVAVKLVAGTLRSVLCTVLAAGFALTPDARAIHGAVFPPPGGGDGGGSGVPQAPPAPSPPAPGPPAPGPAPAGPKGPATGPGPIPGAVPTWTPGNQSPFATGGELGLEPTSWQLWWRYNRDSFLDLKTRVESMHPSTGGDSRARSEDRLEHGIAVAREALTTAKQRDLVSSLLVALARSCDDSARERGTEVARVIAPFAADPDQEIGETAAAALGILRHTAAIPDLVALLHDDEAGRKLAGGRVSTRTRAFAAYGLGIAAARSEREDVHAFIAHHLQRELESSRGAASVDVPAACVIALGLVPLPSDEDAVSIRPRTSRALAAIPPRSRAAQAAALVRFLADKNRPDGARAHVPDALARLGENADPDLRDEIARELTAILDRKSREDDGVLRGAVLAIGRLADCDADGADVRMRIALRRAVDASDMQARLFALISMAQVAVRPGTSEDPSAVQSDVQSLLLERLARGRNRERSWAALALGILEHGRAVQARSQQGGAVQGRAFQGRVFQGREIPPAVRAGLRRALLDAGAPDQVGAIAIAIGLCGDRSSTKELLAKLDDVRDPVGRGHIATALGLLGAPEAVKPLRAILAKSRFQPDLMRETAIALALLGDTDLETTLLEELRSAKSLASQAGVARALGFAGTLSTLDPLAKMVRDTSLTSGARAFAAVALGMVCDRERLPWNAFLAAGVNYPSAPATLSDGQAGILDIL